MQSNEIHFKIVSSLDFASIKLGPFFLAKKLPFAALVLKDLANFLPEHFNTICSLFLWETGFSNFQGIFSLKKATRSSFYL